MHPLGAYVLVRGELAVFLESKKSKHWQSENNSSSENGQQNIQR